MMKGIGQEFQNRGTPSNTGHSINDVGEVNHKGKKINKSTSNSKIPGKERSDLNVPKERTVSHVPSDNESGIESDIDSESESESDIDSGIESDSESLRNELIMEVEQVGDRINAIRRRVDDKNIFEDKQDSSKIVKALTSKIKPSRYIDDFDKKEIGLSKIYSLDQLTMSKVEPSYVPDITHDQKIIPVRQGRSIELPDREEEHTINLDGYLSNRLPSGLIDKVKKIGAEFFLVTSEPGNIAAYYQDKGFNECTKVSSPTSTDFYIVRSSETGREKVVVSGIGSNTRLEHQVLQFHFSGVDVDMQLTSIGSIDDCKSSSVNHLESELKNVAADEKILYVGARWKVMETIANQIYGLSGDNEGEGYKKLNPKNCRIGPFFYDISEIEYKGKKVAIAALRMPNGELSYDAVRAFAESGFKKIIMCGAGGRISGNANIGDYIYLNESSYKQETMKLDENRTLLPDKFEYLNISSPSNTTVNSPLIETKQWLDQQKEDQTGSVDVETAHIFRAINDSSDDILVMPGMFVSDVVGEHPLEDKIAGNGADNNLSAFIKHSLEKMLL